MKKAIFLLTLLFVCLAVIVSGCSMEPKGFVQDTRPGLPAYNSKAQVYRSVNVNGQMAWDDWDTFWLMDRPSTSSWLRTSRY